ncbi:MAG: NAD(P)H-hydrate epimerase [Treponema sp.]|nr:NAD(P)H-hydrate epimerase [Treponema sp.]
MKKVFSNPAQLEKIAKEHFSIPDFLMMENAASSMAIFIQAKTNQQNLHHPKVLILCGKGNNGGDGYALARLICHFADVVLYRIQPPVSPEALAQEKMCINLGISFFQCSDSSSQENLFSTTYDFIVDCIYGTGFKGVLSPDIKKLLDLANSTSATRIACDIPSGLYFNAHYTISMGEYKSVFYSDLARNVCGKIIIANLGLPQNKFEEGLSPDFWLLEKDDAELPFRKNKASHKGTYGHTVVFAGEKAGAGIIAATSAINFGSGLTSILATKASNLNQFKISPELMICESIPPKTTSIVLGPGFSFNNFDSELYNSFLHWAQSTPNPAIVLDASIFSAPESVLLLETLNNLSNARIILTPHLSELSIFLKNLFENATKTNCLNRIIMNFASQFTEDFKTETYFSVKNLANSVEIKKQAGILLNECFPQSAVIMKSANTFISYNKECYICADGAQCLSKGGSGDVLAGMTGALLAQGYDVKTAAITAVESHALAATAFGEDAFNLSPEKLIQVLLSEVGTIK